MKCARTESSPSSVRAGAGIVTFNVGGKHFEVLEHTIEAKPSTLLATLLDDIGTDTAQPIFVDANPDRFSYILDWYRYGEIHVPIGYPVQSILNDARFFLLPDSINVNGCPHALRAVPCEEDFRGAATSAVLEHWPAFQQYVEGIIAELQENTRDQLTALSERAASEQDNHLGLPGSPRKLNTSKRLELTKFVGYTGGSHAWLDPGSVCNQERLKVLVAELEKRGCKCEFTNATRAVGLTLSVDWQEGLLWEARG